jgi:UDP-N-acetylglucosamine 2-epimerase (non-hydrolysing)
MSGLKITTVIGTRPNIMKIAPLDRAIEVHNSATGVPKIEHVIVHTGQHYNDRMSNIFFRDLDARPPDINLGIGSGSHAEQVGRTMMALERAFAETGPDWVLVVGDVNATLAASLTAKKMGLRICHVEAGLRSMDMTMPEEVNRIVTDRISDLLLTPDRLAGVNLTKEGVAENIYFVGNIMIDTLETQRQRASALSVEEILRANIIDTSMNVAAIPSLEEYVVLTLHRPSNTDSREILGRLVAWLIEEGRKYAPVLWACHPRARKQLMNFGLWEDVQNAERIFLLEPIGYTEMLRLNMGAKVMLTDSGGLQEECCVLGTPCITLRTTTERPITLRTNGGTSVIVGSDIEALSQEFAGSFKRPRAPFRPELWDGRTAERCVQAIIHRSAGSWI